jgi:hypothetical protein
MGAIYLAINNGSYEGWSLKVFPSSKDALKEVKMGGTYGSEWKILRELEVKVVEEEGE